MAEGDSDESAALRQTKDSRKPKKRRQFQMTNDLEDSHVKYGCAKEGRNDGDDVTNLEGAVGGLKIDEEPNVGLLQITPKGIMQSYFYLPSNISKNISAFVWTL